ncbi:MAG: Protein transport protein Sec16B [Bogoriella megaspora]|nr:MAG: Protein transport protein Sec16B [Bogoriella megaspora]
MAATEDGPDFSSAWNPAKRPDTLDDLYSVNHDNSRELQDKTPALRAGDVDAPQEGEFGPQIDQLGDNESDDDFFQRYGSPDLAHEHPPAQVEPFDALLRSGTDQGLSDKIQMSNTDAQVDLDNSGSGTVPTAEQTDSLDNLEQPQILDTLQKQEPETTANYEHQSNLALADEAVDESATAPLMLDTDEPIFSQEASIPTHPSEISAEPLDTPLPLESSIEISAMLDSPTLDSDISASGATDNFNLVAVEPTPDEISWGQETADTSGFLSDLASKENIDEELWKTGSVKQADSLESGERQKEHKPAEDLDDVWKAALGDDELLEDNDADDNPFFADDGEGFLEESNVETHTTATQTATGAYQPSTASRDQRNQLNTQSGFVNTHQQFLQNSQPKTLRSVASQSFADQGKGGYASPYDLPMEVRPKKRANAQSLESVPGQRPIAPPRSSSMQVTSPTGAVVAGPLQSATVLSPPPSRHSNDGFNQKGPSNATAPGPPAPPALATKPSNSDFFADLLVKPRSKGSAQNSRYAPSATTFTPPPAAQPHFAPSADPPISSQRATSHTQFDTQLQGPSKVGPYESTGSLNETQRPQPGPPPTNRYSPTSQNILPPLKAPTSVPPPRPSSQNYASNPTAQASTGPAQNRYASAPKGPPPPSYSKPYAPRTSSPLASHQTSPGRSVGSVRSASNPPSVIAEASNDIVPRQVSVPSSEALQRSMDSSSYGPQSVNSASVIQQLPSDGAQVNGLGLVAQGSPPKAQSNYAPQNHAASEAYNADLGLPSRARTQSPGITMKSSRVEPISTQKATFAHSPSSPSENYQRVIPANLGRRRGVSQDLGYLAPPDETAQDPLERWKGCPVFHWGMAGQVLTSFPKQIPRYGPGHAIPMMKCGPGEIIMQNSKTLFPLPDEISKFPGPLKSKGKKKEVSSWLGQRIDMLRQHSQSSMFGMTQGSEAQSRSEEKILLWSVLRLLVEHDGVLEASPAVDQAVRNLLFSQPTEDIGGNPSFGPNTSSAAIVPSSATKLLGEPIDPSAVEELRQHLLRGEREKAAWHAVDKRLWAHALLISSTLGADTRKQVVREFVRNEVRNVGSNTNSLGALYQVFVGNWEESIDELVPAAARAGFQMVSKSDGSGSAITANEGLDRWRESLCLILSNRTSDDSQAIMTLGKLLAGYGRIEAAHTCFLFARNLAYFGGADDPLSNICLLGADHVNQREELGQDLDSILLTEVYEFALSLGSSSPIIPHLQSYKLYHADLLAENGFKSEAQQYCDAILAAMKSTTRPSAYYHGGLISQLDDLSKRISQSPKDSTSSWISKPSMDKMSGTMWNKFQSFVSGEDSDAASNRSGGGGDGELGPFSKIAGESPVVSRSPSFTDLYGTYGGAAPIAVPPASANSRYAPTSQYASNHKAVTEQSIHPRQNYSSSQPSRLSLESSRSYDPLMPASHSTSPEIMRSHAGQHEPRPSSTPYIPHSGPSPQLIQSNGSQSLSPPGTGYSISSRHSWEAPVTQDSVYGVNQSPHPSSGQFQSQEQVPPHSFQPSPANSFQAPSGSYGPSSSSYQPSSYEPSSYQPYEPTSDAYANHEDADPGEDSKPKKKSYMDDDEDDEIMRRAAALKSSTPSAGSSGREPDDAVRRAAEADAARDAEAKANKKGWFTGWFKKDPNAPPGPIKAKLGEESSFVYDPDLKRWVDKKGGAPPPMPTATPPPPKGPSRTVSLAGGPPTGPPSRTTSSGSMPPPMGSRPPTSAPMMPPSGPPSRTGSPALGPPASGLQNGTPVNGDEASATPPTLTPQLSYTGTPAPAGSAPPSRPPTSMSNTSSMNDLNDLIGAPQARKGGTVKGKKKGGRYVDVMAK